MSVFSPSILNSRVCLITGGGSGIGYEIAKELGKHGARIAIMGRRQNFLDSAVKTLQDHGIQAIGIKGDVRNEEDAKFVITEVVNHFGKLDTLVNSAAGNFLASSEQLSPKGFRTVLEIDAIGVFTMTRCAFEYLKLSKQGVVINISATLQYGATWYQVHASAAKASIDSITRTLGLEWGRYNIRVVGIAPGPIADTAGITKLAPGNIKAMEESIAETIPLHRMGTRTDIAMTAVFLCSNAASFITGETIVVDGGHWLYKQPNIPPDMVLEMSKKVEKKSRNVSGREPISKL